MLGILIHIQNTYYTPDYIVRFVAQNHFHRNSEMKVLLQFIVTNTQLQGTMTTLVVSHIFDLLLPNKAASHAQF